MPLWGISEMRLLSFEKKFFRHFLPGQWLDCFTPIALPLSVPRTWRYPASKLLPVPLLSLVDGHRSGPWERSDVCWWFRGHRSRCSTCPFPVWISIHICVFVPWDVLAVYQGCCPCLALDEGIRNYLRCGAANGLLTLAPPPLGSGGAYNGVNTLLTVSAQKCQYQLDSGWVRLLTPTTQLDNPRVWHWYDWL